MEIEKLVIIRRFFIYIIQLCKYICYVFRLYRVNNYIEYGRLDTIWFTIYDTNTDQILQIQLCVIANPL